MPLREATLENGCMVFLPGSQKGEIAPHQSIGGDTRVHGLEILAAVREADTVACPLPAGGATFTSPRTNGRRFPWQEAKRTARDERSRAAGKA